MRKAYLAVAAALCLALMAGSVRADHHRHGHGGGHGHRGGHWHGNVHRPSHHHHGHHHHHHPRHGYGYGYRSSYYYGGPVFAPLGCYDGRGVSLYFGF